MATEPAELVRTGVAAMCGVTNAHFNDKHWGAAVIAAGLLAREQPMSHVTRSAVIDQAERLADSEAEWFPPTNQSRAGRNRRCRRRSCELGRIAPRPRPRHHLRHAGSESHGRSTRAGHIGERGGDRGYASLLRPSGQVARSLVGTILQRSWSKPVTGFHP